MCVRLECLRKLARGIRGFLVVNLREDSGAVVNS